jgi:hypothetical protein
MNGDAPRNFRPARTSSRIASIPSESAVRRPVRSNTNSLLVERQALRNSCVAGPVRRPTTLTMVVESSDVVSTRTVTPDSYSKRGASIDASGGLPSNYF